MRDKRGPQLARCLALALAEQLLSVATAQPGRPTVCPYPVTYQMNKSTIIMPCNNSGYTDPATTLGWGVVDFDWSNNS